MSQLPLPPWLPRLLDCLNAACVISPWFIRLASQNQVLAMGKHICLSLWPFILELPTNIAAVRDMSPANMVAARNFLGQLADDERHYQELFVKQCLLAGVTLEELNNCNPSSSTLKLCQTMNSLCRDINYQNGIFAIVTAELAATQFSRSVLTHYEQFFAGTTTYPEEILEEGLSWLRLHAKPHTRHALWMMRMLAGIGSGSDQQFPHAVEAILTAILELWECPAGKVLEIKQREQNCYYDIPIK